MTVPFEVHEKAIKSLSLKVKFLLRVIIKTGAILTIKPVIMIMKLNPTSLDLI